MRFKYGPPYIPVGDCSSDVGRDWTEGICKEVGDAEERPRIIWRQVDMIYLRKDVDIWLLHLNILVCPTWKPL